MAASDVVFRHVTRPERYDRARGPLLGFLRLDFKGRALNLMRDEKRQCRYEADYAVQLRIVHQPGASRAHVSQRAALARRLLLAVCTPRDRAACLLWARGEREPGPLAAALGLAHLSPAEQRREAARLKDRIDKLIRRHIRPLMVAYESDSPGRPPRT